MTPSICPRAALARSDAHGRRAHRQRADRPAGTAPGHRRAALSGVRTRYGRSTFSRRPPSSRWTPTGVSPRSGSPSPPATRRFDKIVRNYYSKFRLIPALSEAGLPMAAATEVRFRVAIDDPQTERLRGPEDFVAGRSEAHPSHASATTSSGNTTGCRKSRMATRTRSGIPVPDLVRDGRGRAETESLRKPSESRRRPNAVLKETAKHCRANPEASYFADAYQPAVMKRAGR